jgi:hypothetical protein
VKCVRRYDQLKSRCSDFGSARSFVESNSQPAPRRSRFNLLRRNAVLDTQMYVAVRSDSLSVKVVAVKTRNPTGPGFEPELSSRKEVTVSKG